MSRDYLESYISTLSSSRRERVSALLQEARVGKEQLQTVVARLIDRVEGFEPLVLASETALEEIDGGLTEQNLRQISIKIGDLFDAANLISLLLESHSSILSSEISSVEKELMAMDKYIRNFAYTISENEAFDYAFLEGFSDTEGQDLEFSPSTDRTQTNFGPSEIATVVPDEGVLSISAQSLNTLAIVPSLVDSNSGAFTVEETDISNVVKANQKGWRKVIASANPVRSPLKDGEGSGAQVLLEFVLTGKSPASSIRIAPFSDTPVDIQKIFVYTSEDPESYSNVIQQPFKLDKVKTISFPTQMVHKFRLLINQPVYKRMVAEKSTVEDRYKQTIKSINSVNRQSYRLSFSQRVSEIERISRGGNTSSSRPVTNLRPDRGVMGVWNIAKTVRGNGWRQKGKADLFTQALSGSRGMNGLDFNTGVEPQSHRIAFNEGRAPVPALFTGVYSNLRASDDFRYHYNIGLKRVSIGVEQSAFRSVFISDKLESKGEIGEIKIRTEEEHAFIDRTDRDNNQVTSVEYSVTNVTTPRGESDWIPILPSGEINIVSERAFPDANNTIRFRFPANPRAGVSLYNYGTKVGNNLYYSTYGVDGSVTGIVLQEEFSPGAVYTVDYAPYADYSNINFRSRGFNSIPTLSTSGDETGAGELFLGTGGRNTVKLAHTPYVNLNLTQDPIKVKLSDGTFALNLTDYVDKADPSFPEVGLYFIHSGDTLIFNQPIITSFRVYYQYSENNVRFRVVLRCNDTQFATPKVDYVHVKAKTRKPVPILVSP